MKQFLFCLTISLYGSILAVGQTTGTLTSHKFQSGGIERSYKYYQPANLSSGAPLCTSWLWWHSRSKKIRYESYRR